MNLPLKLPRLVEDVNIEGEEEEENEFLNPLALPLLPVPSRFHDEFEVLETIGKGGFGVVVAARKLLEDEEYAVKVIRRTDTDRQTQSDRQTDRQAS